MPITANFTPATFRLAITGTNGADGISVRRDGAGTLLVNNGAVPITGGTATVANTSLITAEGGGDNDSIALDESFGALPAAELTGGSGNDTLTGGSGGDSLYGDTGNDTLLGKGGNDLLFGGTENDVLTGGDADDQMFGEGGNDRMIWNPGDDTDLMEGGDGTDTVEVNGGNGAEVFTTTANGTRVRFDRLDPAPFSLDIGTSESLVLNMSGGDDSFSATGNLAALIGITVDGGTGNDTILGSNGADTLLGGDGNDFIDGQQGNDVAFLGLGTDTFQWDPGDGSDVVEGQGDVDTLLFNGSAANEVFDLVANGGRLLFTRNVGAIIMDLNDVEHLTLNALGGTDTINLGDLTGTDATQIDVNLAGTIGGTTGDGQADIVTATGRAASEAITITGAGTSLNVTGLFAPINLTNVEGANDSLTVGGAGGNDTITATTLPAGIARLTLDGGTGADTLLGSQGADTFLGGDGNDVVVGDNGNDVAFLGANDDRFEWAPGDGNDVVEGQSGFDELRFAGSNASETINIAANGGRILFLRDVAAVTLDLDDVERIRFEALGGTDNIIVGDLSGTDAKNVDILLQASGGGGDGAADTVTVTGSNGADTVSITSPGGVATVSGLTAAVALFNPELANDQLIFNAAGGDDVINAAALATNLLRLTVNGGLGADLFIGSGGNDVFNGGDGNDTALLGAGNDIVNWNPGDDNDVIEGQGGTDTLNFNMSNVAENVTLSANGGRILLFRDVANVTMDLNDTETIRLTALGGADTITVNDLTGTDAQQLIIDLASTAGGASGDAQADSLELQGGSANETIVATAAGGGTVTISGLPAAVTINQVETGDRLTIRGGLGNDSISAVTVTFSIAVVTLDGGGGNDTVTSNGDGTYLGGDGDDLILAGLTSVSEVIDGGTGIDTLDTRTWGGTYTINMVTGVTNFSGEAFLNFENLITGEGADTITGTTAANVIATNGGIDTINADAGNDIVAGGAAGDLMDGGSGTDILDYRTSSGAVTVNLITNSVSGGDAAGDMIANFEGAWGSGLVDSLTGNGLDNELRGFAGNDTLVGNDGNDTLDGGINDDTMTGGFGNDTYVVDSAGDVINEVINQGLDTILTSVSYSIASMLGIEWLKAVDPAATTAINLTGNSLNNRLFGNAGANALAGGTGDDVLDGGDGADTLNGGAGNDNMIGGLGNDVFVVGDLADTVSELAGGGTDSVSLMIASGLSYTLTNNVERMVVLSNAVTARGNALDNVISNAGTGNSLFGEGGADLLIGNANADILDGGTGNDTLKGGLGDDLYRVDAVGDVVTELAGQGSDTVESAISYVLGAELENLKLLGGAVSATGNGLANTITGNGAANILDGAGGADTLIGGLGDDLYRVDAGDTIVEVAGEGTDTVQVAASYTLAAGLSIETLETTNAAGLTAISLTGNSGHNKLVGNAGANALSGAAGDDRLEGGDGADTLVGGAGTDVMIGGTGNDTYVVADLSDVVSEAAGAGMDSVSLMVAAGSNYVLAANIERMTVLGNTTTAHGNALDNVIANAGTGNILFGEGGNDTLVGSANAETLRGGADSDSLRGAGGNDILQGDGGNDFFVFAAASGQDEIIDFTHLVDRIDLSALGIMSFATVQGMMSQAGADTVINLGGGNTITLGNIVMGTLTAGDFILTGGSSAIVQFDAGDTPDPVTRAAFEPELERPQSIWSIATLLGTGLDTI